MLIWPRKGVSSRRESIRKDRPDTMVRRWGQLRASGVLTSLAIALVLAAVASAMMMLREEVVPYRPGHYVAHDIVSRVEFTVPDKEKLSAAQRRARVRQSSPALERWLPPVLRAIQP